MKVIDLAALLPERIPVISRRDARSRGAATRSYSVEGMPVAEVVVTDSRAEIVKLELSACASDNRAVEHVLRYIAADLAPAGVDALSIPQPVDKRTERVLVAASFGVVRGGALARKTPRFPPLLRRRHSYASLRGANRVVEQVALAEAVVQRLRAVSGVEIILALGSIARGFADQYSDIDIFVIGRDASLCRLPAGETWASGHDFDIFVIDRDEQPYASWDATRRQAVSEGVVSFARSREVVSDLRRAVTPRRSDLRARVADLLLQLAWIGFHPRSLDGQTRHGYSWVAGRDAWLRRGDVASAHLTIDQATAYLVELLFAANRFDVPDPKWRRFLVRTLEWLPRRFDARLLRVECGGRDEKSFAMRTNELLSLIDETFEHLLRERFVPKNVYATYLQTTRVYATRPSRRRTHADR